MKKSKSTLKRVKLVAFATAVCLGFGVFLFSKNTQASDEKIKLTGGIYTGFSKSDIEEKLGNFSLKQVLNSAYDQQGNPIEIRMIFIYNNTYIAYPKFKTEVGNIKDIDYHTNENGEKILTENSKISEVISHHPYLWIGSTEEGYLDPQEDFGDFELLDFYLEEGSNDKYVVLNLCNHTLPDWAGYLMDNLALEKKQNPFITITVNEITEEVSFEEFLMHEHIFTACINEPHRFGRMGNLRLNKENFDASIIYSDTYEITVEIDRNNVIKEHNEENNIITKKVFIDTGREKLVGSLWTSYGDNIAFTTGNVGIGTQDPTAKLEVDGNIKAKRVEILNENGEASLRLGNTEKDDDNDLVSKYWSIDKGYLSSQELRDALTIYSSNPQSIIGGPNIPFIADYRDSSVYLSLGRMGAYNGSGNAAGRVGIGTTNPEERLDVKGNIKAEGLKITGNKDKKSMFIEFDPEDEDYDISWKIGKITSAFLNEQNVAIGTESDLRNSFVITLENDFAMAISPRNDVYFNGEVGIGVVDPEERLEVDGNIKTEGLKISSLAGGGNRYVCVDNDGVIFASDDPCTAKTGQGSINQKLSCGIAARNAYTTKPDFNLCTTEGTASEVTGDGPWTWTCSAPGYITSDLCTAGFVGQGTTTPSSSGSGPSSGGFNGSTSGSSSGGSSVSTRPVNTTPSSSGGSSD